MSMQNIINACFAICVTLLIYQNNQLSKELDSKYGYSSVVNVIESCKPEGTAIAWVSEDEWGWVTSNLGPSNTIKC
jgi:hypothetical protein